MAEKVSLLQYLPTACVDNGLSKHKQVHLDSCQINPAPSEMEEHLVGSLDSFSQASVPRLSVIRGYLQVFFPLPPSPQIALPPTSSPAARPSILCYSNMYIEA